MSMLRRFVCCRQGFARSGPSDKWKKKKAMCHIWEVRCGCNPYITHNRVGITNEWLVSMKDEHNHTLVTPSKHRYLRTNEVILERSHQLFKTLMHPNVAPSKQFTIALVECGGYNEMFFSQTDFSNM